MNTSNPSSVSPLPCSILDAVSQSAIVSVCMEGEEEGRSRGRMRRERGGGRRGEKAGRMGREGDE